MSEQNHPQDPHPADMPPEYPGYSTVPSRDFPYHTDLPRPRSHRKGTPAWLIVMVIVGIGLVIGCTVLAGAAILADQDPVDRSAPASKETRAVSDRERTEAPAAGTRDNPIPAGETFEVGDWEVSIGETSDGVEEILAENMFNDSPADGYAYAMAEIEVTYTGAGSETPFWALSWQFLGPDGVMVSDFCGVLPDDLSEVGEMFEGAEASGNICVPVPADTLHDGVWVVAPLISLDDDDRVYVSTTS